MGTINDRGEFRRQMLSVIAGALISMATTTGIATFQWYTATAERHRMEQAESLSQFGAAVGSLASLQGGIYHQAERLALLSARANRLAVASESGDKQVASAYEDYVKLAWDVAFEEAHLYEEVGKSTAAVSLAYYKLAFAFKGIDSLGFFPYPEKNAGTYILGASPNPGELRKYAAANDTQARSLLAKYDWLGQWANRWNSNLAALKERGKMQ